MFTRYKYNVDSFVIKFMVKVYVEIKYHSQYFTITILHTKINLAS